MVLEFHGDAISLSGLTGTRLKCDVIRTYYPFWWKITSGGRSAEYERPTSIIELNAATGEVYIKDTDQTVLGSAGHALNLKVNHLKNDEIDTNNLKIVLVEENEKCYDHLKRVIKRRWKNVSIKETEDLTSKNQSNIYLLNNNLDDALEKISEMDLGNSIFYFDPLRSVKWSTVERVARTRFKKPFQTGTEFIIFLFTSDWFLGRGGDLSPLPKHTNQKLWTGGEKNSVEDANDLFGGQHWQKLVLTDQPLKTRESILLDLYKDQLCSWFRYVLPMPFNPKGNQLFHLILCSNYEAGVQRTKGAYSSKTLNLPYKPNNANAYRQFVKLHPETTKNLTGRQKSLPWKILWAVIKNHEGGICDCYCKDFKKIEYNNWNVQHALGWLHHKGYLLLFKTDNLWQIGLNRYKLNWVVIRKNLGVNFPSELHPLTPNDLGQTEMGQYYEALKNWKQALSNR